MANSLDVWIVLLDEIMNHVQKFVDENPMKYKGKELKAYTTGLGMTDYWRCKVCGYPMTTKSYELDGGYCQDCRNE
jgi:rubrerythrin